MGCGASKIADVELIKFYREKAFDEYKQSLINLSAKCNDGHTLKMEQENLKEAALKSFDPDSSKKRQAFRLKLENDMKMFLESCIEKMRKDKATKDLLNEAMYMYKNSMKKITFENEMKLKAAHEECQAKAMSHFHWKSLPGYEEYSLKLQSIIEESFAEIFADWKAQLSTYDSVKRAISSGAGTLAKAATGRFMDIASDTFSGATGAVKRLLFTS